MKKIMLLCGITLLTANVYASKSTDSDEHGELDLRHSMASTQLLDSSGEFSEPEAEGETVTAPQRTPENDKVLFTIQNLTKKDMPVKLWGNITDKTTNYSIELRTLRWVVSSNSYKSVMFSECELLAWHIQHVNQSIDTKNLPLNCEFVFYLGCGTYHTEAATDEYNQMEAATYLANEYYQMKFPIGQTYYVHPVEYVSKMGLHTKAFKVTKDANPPVLESTEDLSDES